MHFLVFDGETCNTPVIDGQLDAKNGQVYDLGGAVIDEFGNEKERFSVVNEDVFFGMPEQMKEAYYAEKIPQYLEDMRMGNHKIVNTWGMYKVVKELCDKYIMPDLTFRLSMRLCAIKPNHASGTLFHTA